MANRFSKTTRAQQEILNLIARDRMVSGDRLPPEKELERTMGVSIITVRRALAELADRGLIERIQGKGTFLSQDITGLNALGTIAFVLVDRPTAPYQHSLEDARLAARRRSYDLKLVVTGSAPDNDVTAELRGASGVIVTGYVSDEWLDWLEMMHLPTVVMGVHKLKKRVWTVQHDFSAAMGQLVDGLVARGARRIGFVNGATRYQPAHLMYAGYRDAMDRHGLAWSDDDVVWCRYDDRLGSLAEYFHEPERRQYDGLIVESGCLQALLMYVYEHSEVTARPIIGLLGEHLERPRGLTRFELVTFDHPIADAAVDLMFEAMSSSETEARTVNLAPGVARFDAAPVGDPAAHPAATT